MSTEPATSLATPGGASAPPPASKQGWLSPVWLPLLIGLLAFFTVTGGQITWTDNIAWLERGDPATHYLGWLFFRASPWQWPVGLNPDYGLELASTIVYADAIPLLALGFKTLSNWLPQPFQYFGLWVLACFVLQAWFGWLLMTLFTPHRALRALGCAFFAFSPVMLWRLHPEIGHLSLVGQFYILAALYLVLRPDAGWRVGRWGALLATAALTHAYLLTLAGLLWLADLVQRQRCGELSTPKARQEFFGLTTACGLLCWQAGYFGVGAGVITGGYGHYGTHLLTLLDPGRSDYGLWSQVLPDLPGDAQQHEGFGYLGLGLLSLLPWASLALWRRRTAVRRMLQRHRTLGMLLVLLTLLAITHRISLGHATWALPLPKEWVIVLGTFRASARLFWPVYYAIFLCLLVLIISGYTVRSASTLLALALGLQLLDTQGGWSVIRQHLMQPNGSAWATPLQSPFWSQAAQRYTRVRSLPSGFTPHWAIVADYAARHGMATDAVYLARLSQAGVMASSDIAQQVLQQGRFEPQTLYVLDDATLATLRPALVRPQDCLTRIDGLNVLAPGWSNHSPCPSSVLPASGTTR